MITFSNVNLIALVSLMNLFAVYCTSDQTNQLNCTITDDRMTKTDSKPISVINKCPEDYKNQDIVAKCQDLISRDRPFDQDLYVPVTNVKTNTTYWNKFCAICNNESQSDLHSALAWDKQTSLCTDVIPTIRNSNVDGLRELTQIFIDKGMNLTAKFPDDLRELECSMKGDWPVQLLHYVTPCLIDNFLAGQRKRLERCQYAEKNGKICAKMQLYTDGFRLALKNKMIDYDDKLSEFSFARGEYFVEAGYPNLFYVCEEPVTNYGTNRFFKIFHVVAYTIAGIFYLWKSFSFELLDQFEQNTAKIMGYLYLMGSIPLNMLLLFIYLSYPVPWVVAQLAQFLWHYHYVWTTLIYMERTMLHMTFPRGIQNDTPIRYLIYSILVFYFIISTPIDYYFQLVEDENYIDSQMSSMQAKVEQYSCPVIPSHLAVSRLQSSDDSLHRSFNMFLPLLLCNISVVILLDRICNRWESKGKTPHIYSMHTLTISMTIIMGIHWILYMIYVNHSDDISYTILGVSIITLCEISIDFHYVIGVIVFVVTFRLRKNISKSNRENVNSTIVKFEHDSKGLQDNEDVNGVEFVLKSRDK